MTTLIHTLRCQAKIIQTKNMDIVPVGFSGGTPDQLKILPGYYYLMRRSFQLVTIALKCVNLEVELYGSGLFVSA